MQEKKLENIKWFKSICGMNSDRAAYKVAENVPGRIKIGNRLRFDRAKVLAWIDAGCPAEGSQDA